MYLTIGFIFLIYKNCESIPLPGINPSDYIQIETPAVHPQFLPFDSAPADAYSFKPSIKYAPPDNTLSSSAATFGNANSISGFIPSSTSSPKDPSHSSPIPKSTLENLLNSLYGNDSWRKELSSLLDTNNNLSSTSDSPLSNTSHELDETRPQGFLSNHVSFNSLQNPVRLPSNQAGSVNPGKSSNEITESHSMLLSKSKEKSVGSSKSDKDRTSQNIIPTSRNIIGLATDATKLINSSDNKNNSGNNTFGIQQHVSLSNSESQFNSQTNNGKPNTDGSGQHSFAGNGVFDPDTVNHMSYAYNPEKFGFVTQTGSRPANADHTSTFDADALNRNFMQESFGHSPPGVNDKFAVNLEQHGASKEQMNVHAQANSPTFDASALNMRLLLGDRNMVDNVPVGVNHEQSQTVLSSGLAIGGFPQSQHQNSSMPSSVGIKKELQNTRDGQTSQNKVTPDDKPDSIQSTYNFIPGDLFPGQQYSKQGTPGNINGPTFLNGQKTNILDQTFNPNVLNLAQRTYNPNDISWISTRSTDDFGYDLKSEYYERVVLPQDDPETTPTPSTQTTDNVQPIPANNNDQTVFNPNDINTAQGNHFVPGQLTPDASLYQKFAYGANQILVNNDVNNSKNGSSVNSFSNFAFNPNTINNLMTEVYSGQTNNNSSAIKTGYDFASNSFDPNAVNVGFGNVLGNQNGSHLTMSSFSFGFPQENKKNNTADWSSGFSFSSSGNSDNGFDPNAANIGFGSKNYYFGSLGGSSSSSFSSGFDANKWNQVIKQEPHGTTDSKSSSENSQFYSSFIGSFSPDKVNTVSYNPNKFNNLQLHFDPVDMLLKNPGIDKATLQSAVFDPDKINAQLTSFALSPVKMFQANLGADNLPISKGESLIANTSSNSSTNFDTPSSPYDPLKQLMQLASLFKPGTLGGSPLSSSQSVSTVTTNTVRHSTSTNPSTTLASSAGTSVHPSLTTTNGITKSADAFTTVGPSTTEGSNTVTLHSN